MKHRRRTYRENLSKLRAEMDELPKLKILEAEVATEDRQKEVV